MVKEIRMEGGKEISRAERENGGDSMTLSIAPRSMMSDS